MPKWSSKVFLIWKFRAISYSSPTAKCKLNFIFNFFPPTRIIQKSKIIFKSTFSGFMFIGWLLLQQAITSENSASQAINQNFPWTTSTHPHSRKSSAIFTVAASIWRRRILPPLQLQRLTCKLFVFIKNAFNFGMRICLPRARFSCYCRPKSAASPNCGITRWTLYASNLRKFQSPKYCESMTIRYSMRCSATSS